MSALSRRDFLRRTGWVAAGTTLLLGTGCSLVPALPTRAGSDAGAALGWLQLLPDGRLQLLDPRAELGQDAGTGLLQVLADALDVDIARITLARPHTGLLAPVRSTVGSESIAVFAPLLAHAGQALAALLARRAAARLGVAIDALRRTPDGFVTASGATLAFGVLAGDGELLEAADLPLAPSPVRRGRYVGQPTAAPDLEAILRARPLFASDVRLPDMLHGRLLRATHPDALPLRLDDRRARALPGYVGTVSDDTLVCVLGTRSGVLDRAAAGIEVTWSAVAPASHRAITEALDVDRRLARGALEHVPVDGRIDPAAPWSVDLRLSIPFAAHAFLEPRVAVARWAAERLEVWTGTQDPFYVRAHLARTLGIDEADVTVHPQRCGGAFGGRTLCTVELEAARIARRVGRPVRIQWTREDEFRHGFHRPPSEHRVRVRLGPDGRLDDWWHAFASGHVLFTSAAMPSWMQAATSLVPDPGVGRGAAPPYDVRRTRVEFDDVRLPVATGPWRGLGAAPNGCAVELAMDMAARAAGRDPMQFRLDHLDRRHARLRGCVERMRALLAAPANAAAPGSAIGTACATYKQDSHVAVAAEVRRVDGRARVTRMWCVHDCGLVVNPDRVRAQVEGNLVWALGMVLGEALEPGPAGVAPQQFDGYHLPRFLDVPPMAIELVQSDAPPSGAAETAIAAAPAAILNALLALDGQPARRLPVQ